MTLAAALLIALPVGADLPAATGEDMEPMLVPYTATYNVIRNRIRVGRARVELSALEDGVWLYRTESRTAGLAALLRNVSIVEHSRFRVEDGWPVSLEHGYAMTGSRRDRDFHLDFDWVRRTVSGIFEGEPVEMDLPAGSVDRHTMPLTLVLDMRSGRPYPRHLVMVDRTRLREFEVRPDGVTELATEAGTFETVRMVQQRLDKEERRFLVWLAPALGHVPVRIQSVDDEGATITLELTDFQL